MGVGGGGRGALLQRLALLCALLLLPLGANSQPATTTAPRSSPHAPTDSVLDARTRDVASGLRCPVCQGESIEQSPSELAQELKAVVREQLAAGRTPEQVREYFVARYGEWILLQPKAIGFNVAVYILPPLLLVGGIVLIVFLLRRWTRPAAEQGATGGESPVH
jgi:cytochrome c-type biogenesis protein CcmH/NrfF